MTEANTGERNIPSFLQAIKEEKMRKLKKYPSFIERIRNEADWVIKAQIQRSRVREKFVGDKEYISLFGFNEPYQFEYIEVYIESNDIKERRAIKLRDFDLSSGARENETEIYKEYQKISEWIQHNAIEILRNYDIREESIEIIKRKEQYFTLVQNDTITFTEPEQDSAMSKKIVNFTYPTTVIFKNISKEIKREKKVEIGRIMSKLSQMTEPGIDIGIINEMVKRIDEPSEYKIYNLGKRREVTKGASIPKYKEDGLRTNELAILFPKYNWIKDKIKIDSGLLGDLNIDIESTTLIICGDHLNGIEFKRNQKRGKGIQSKGKRFRIHIKGCQIRGKDKILPNSVNIIVYEQDDNWILIKDCCFINSELRIYKIDDESHKVEEENLIESLIEVENNRSNHLSKFIIFGKNNSDIRIKKNTKIKNIYINTRKSSITYAGNKDIEDLNMITEKDTEIKYIDIDKDTVKKSYIAQYKIGPERLEDYVRIKYNNFSKILKNEEEKGNAENIKEIKKITKFLENYLIFNESNKTNLTRAIKSIFQKITSNRRQNIIQVGIVYVLITAIFDRFIEYIENGYLGGNIEDMLKSIFVKLIPLASFVIDKIGDADGIQHYDSPTAYLSLILLLLIQTLIIIEAKETLKEA